jgi:hypothetical protein
MIYMMLLTGLIPVFLAFLVLAFLIGRAAKKRGKNPWMWGSAIALLLLLISWNQLPSWAAFTYYNGMAVMQTMKPKEPVTTLGEAKKINIHSSVDGVYFDVPLTYHFRGYDRKAKGWHTVTRGQIEGTERPAIDYIHIYALLPDLVPMSEENLAEFEAPGWGKIVRASLTHIRPWDYYFKNFFEKTTERRPDSPAVPGMQHYYTDLRDDMYLSHDHATPDLTRITCSDQNFHRDVSPACKVETSYRPAQDIIASEHIEGAIFRLEYHFSSQYLSQWQEIDKKLKLLFDQFIRNTAQNPSAHQIITRGGSSASHYF